VANGACLLCVARRSLSWQVSTRYYTWMERSDLSGDSEDVLLRWSGRSRRKPQTPHLVDLARAAAGPRQTPRSKPAPRVSPQLRLLIDTMEVPAVAMTQLGDSVASNPMGRALFSDLRDAVEARILVAPPR
jgi:hypothetical protein